MVSASSGGVLHQPVVLGAGPGDADGVGLLEGVVADHEGRDLAGQHHDRDRVHQRVGHAGDGVGGAGAGGDQHHAGPAGGAGIALGGMGRALLVPDQDVADVVLLEDLVVDRQHRAAGIAEHRVHALVLQGLDHHLRAGHVTGHRPLRSSAAPAGAAGAIFANKKAPLGGHGAIVRRALSPSPGSAPRQYDQMGHALLSPQNV